MFIDFTEERLHRVRSVRKIFRYKVHGGWYVRAFIINKGAGEITECECALFIPDPNYAWVIEESKWEKIKAGYTGGSYRLNVPGGWVIFSTLLSGPSYDDGRYTQHRIGSMVFIPDPENTWECKTIEETSSVFAK